MSEQLNVPPAQHWSATSAPLIAIVGTVATHFLFYGRFLLCPSDNQTCIRFDPAPMLRGVKTAFTSDPSVYVGGAMWVLASGAHVLVNLAALFASVYVIREGIGERAKGKRGALTIALFIAWAALLALMPSMQLTGDTGAPGPRLLLETVGRMLPSINTYNRLFDALGLTVGVMLAVAACAAIRRDAVEDAEGKTLRRRMRLLRTILYAGAAALVVSVIRLSVTLNWGGSFLPAATPPAVSESATLITGIVNTLGIYYTILLAAVYAPAALVLRRRANALASQQPPEKQDEWLKARGLALSFTEYLPRVVAILAPLLAGPVADLVKSVLNVGGK